MTAYKFVTTTTFDKEFKKLDKSIQKIIAKYIKINLINSTNPFYYHNDWYRKMGLYGKLFFRKNLM